LLWNDNNQNLGLIIRTREEANQFTKNITMTHTQHGWNFDNSYARLPKKMYALAQPEVVPNPKVVLFNDALAIELGLRFNSSDEEKIANWFSGNALITEAAYIAQAYAGHQFGHFTMLGDGRAILIGEHITPKKTRLDIQLKGAGQTFYSRRGDGKATLRSMLREYLISEAMHGLGIPSSRSLAVITSDEKVYREDIHEGGILTRIASSHIRVGTFEYVKHFLSVEELREFTDYTIDRHYPLLKDSEHKALDLLKAVMEKQIDLIVHWMRIGFIHGVMNTDNMSIAGETFDYGPCAFMNAYDPKTVFSSIDTRSRYAFGNQPKIAQWNLACLAEALLPLIHKDVPEAVKQAEAVLNLFPAAFEEKWNLMMGKKLGLNYVSTAENELIHELLDWMEKNNADYTNTFLMLASDLKIVPVRYQDATFMTWQVKWKSCLAEQGQTMEKAIQIMRSKNAAFIPRNHIVEQALDEVCQEERDFTLFNQLLEVLRNPYEKNESLTFLQNPPADGDGLYKTYCGT
jgi:serine/tyrosine/threonine adenylyltransferase